MVKHYCQRVSTTSPPDKCGISFNSQALLSVHHSQCHPPNVFLLICLKCLLIGKANRFSRVNYLHKHVVECHKVSIPQYLAEMSLFDTVQWKDARSFRLKRKDGGAVERCAHNAVSKLQGTWGADHIRYAAL